MPNKETFSKRFGHYSINAKEITVREDAPFGLRRFIPVAFYELKKDPSNLRAIVCRILRGKLPTNPIIVFDFLNKKIRIGSLTFISTYLPLAK